MLVNYTHHPYGKEISSNKPHVECTICKAIFPGYVNPPRGGLSCNGKIYKQCPYCKEDWSADKIMDREG
jgi:hypothetical protein